MLKKVFALGIVLALYLGIGHVSLAVSFNLVPPSGELSRGQDVPFTVNIDTQGASVTSIQTGMTYDTQYLEYVSAVAGAAMDSISVDQSQGTGKLLFTGTKAAGFTGTGVFATVTFKIIAQQSGETELCTLWAPSPTPTTPPVVPTTPPVVPTSPPPPTALPQTGFDAPKNTGALVGLLFVAIASGVYLYSRKQMYTPTRHSHKTHKTKHTT